MHSREGSGLVITILLTLVVMTIGVYTLSKIQPFAKNIQWLEHSVQARYHAKSGEEIAKLLYYDNLEKSKEVLDDPNFSSLSASEKAQAFCRTDGKILVNNKTEREAVRECIAEKIADHCHGSTCHPGHSDQLAQTSCNDPDYSEGKNYTDYLPAGYTAANGKINIDCHGETSDTTNAVADATGGIDTTISSQTARIPQDCQGDSDILYTTDGDCQNWNKLISGKPSRLNLSNIEGLALDQSGIGTNYSFAIRFRLPNLEGTSSDGFLPQEYLQISADSKDAPMVLWNLYDDQNAFFPAEPEHALTRINIATENSSFTVSGDGNNGQADGNLTSWRVLGSAQYKGIWEDPTICANAETDPSFNSDHVTVFTDGTCQLSLTAFFKHGLGSCINRACFLELNLVGDLSLGIYDGAWDPIPDSFHPDGIKAPFIEYQVLVGRSGGTSGGDELKINDPRPVITSIGESWGYSIKEETNIREDLLIPSVSSPIGR